MPFKVRCRPVLAEGTWTCHPSCLPKSTSAMLYAFAKLWKATVIFAISVRPPAWNKSVTTGRIFRGIWYLNVFRKSVETPQVSLKSDKDNGHYTWRPIYILDHISLSSSWNEKCFRQSCRQNQNTHFMFNKFFRESCRLWDNVEKYCRVGRPQMTIWRMFVAYWTCKVTNTYEKI
jgi:hypothetical protein